MSTWEDFKRNVKHTAQRAAKKTEEFADAATLKIKITNKEITRDGEYRTLGKLTYQKLKSGGENQKLTEEISKSIEKLDVCLAELAALEAEYEDLKAKKETDKTDKSKSSAPTGEEIMEDFNRARKQGDDDLISAKAQVENAKAHSDDANSELEKAKLLAQEAESLADDALELSMDALKED